MPHGERSDERAALHLRSCAGVSSAGAVASAARDVAVARRQRPGTAQGFIFLSMEDETGISNIIITPQLYEHERVLVTRGRFLKVYGKLQSQDGVVHVKAESLEHLYAAAIEVRSHDFH